MTQLFKNVTFINFNYDRTLECFLFHALTQSAGIEANTAADIISKTQIIRPYGSLGTFDGRAGANIGGSLDGTLFERLDGIRTFTEAHQNSIKNEIEAKLNESKLIICLGFGFHPQNMELLSPSSDAISEERGRRSRRVFATVKGIHAENMTVIKDSLSKALRTGAITAMDMPAGTMLKELRPAIMNAAAAT